MLLTLRAQVKYAVRTLALYLPAYQLSLKYYRKTIQTALGFINSREKHRIVFGGYILKYIVPTPQKKNKNIFDVQSYFTPVLNKSILKHYFARYFYFNVQ